MTDRNRNGDSRASFGQLLKEVTGFASFGRMENRLCSEFRKNLFLVLQYLGCRVVWWKKDTLILFWDWGICTCQNLQLHRLDISRWHKSYHISCIIRLELHSWWWRFLGDQMEVFSGNPKKTDEQFRSGMITWPPPENPLQKGPFFYGR